MHKLPNEMLLEIFERLEYKDLKALRRVCKPFYRLLKKGDTTPLLAATLFEEEFQELPKAEINFAIHPILKSGALEFLLNSDCPSVGEVEVVGLFVPEEESAATVNGNGNGNGTGQPSPRLRRLIDLHTANDNATSPPLRVATLEWQIGYGMCLNEEVPGTGEGGVVTVLDVMKGYARVSNILPGRTRNKRTVYFYDGIFKVGGPISSDGDYRIITEMLGRMRIEREWKRTKRIIGGIKKIWRNIRWW